MAEDPAPTAPYQPKAFQLTPEQIAQILKDANRPGWRMPDRAMVSEETELKTNTVTGKTGQVPTGRFFVNAIGPNGVSQPIYMRQGPTPRTVDTVGGQIQTQDWIVEAPDAVKTPTTPAANTEKDEEGNVYEKDPATGEWHVVIKGTGAGTANVKATAARTQAELDDMLKNEKNGIGFISTVDFHKLQQEAARTGISANELKEKVRQFDERNKVDWATEKRLGKVAEAGIDLTKAQTTQVDVETQLNRQRLEQAIAAAPDEAAARKLTNELAQLNLDEIRRKSKQPTIQDLGSGATYGLMTPGGTVEEKFRQGYVPKTLGEVGARIGQIQQLAYAKKDEIMGKVSETYTPEQAYADFTKWYDGNIAPQVPALRAAQEEAQQARGIEQATMRTAAQQAATAAGKSTIDIFQAQAGPNYAAELGKYHKSMGSGKMPTDVDTEKMLTRPDLNIDVAGRVAEALKYIDPTAASMTGAPPPTWAQMNPQDALNMTNLWGTGAQPKPAAAPVTAAVAEAGASKNPNYQPQPSAPDLTAATPIIVNAQGETEWQYPFAPADEDYMAQQEAEAAAAQQAEFEAQQQADLAAMMSVPAAPTYRPTVRRAPVRGAPTPVNRAPFAQQALEAGLGGGGLGPMGPGPQTPIYDPAAEGVPVKPIWAPGGYVPPSYVYGGWNAAPTPY